MVIPTTQLIDKALPSEVFQIHYEAYNGETLISDLKHKETIKDYLKFSTVLFDDINIVTFIDPESLQNAQNTLFKKLLISILIIITFPPF